MKTSEVLPSKDNIIETFRSNAVDRNKDVIRFAELLDSIEGPCSIALDGAWGSGKTFFVHQTKMILDAYNKHNLSKESDDISIETVVNRMVPTNYDLQPVVTVYYDAWENDNDVDPLLSLVFELLRTVDTDYSFETGPNTVKILSNIAEFFTGAKITLLTELLKKEDFLSELRQKKDLQSQVKDFLNSLLPEKGNRLTVFVDELDRCKPSYAVQFLERIKHYFTNENITFVFSINTKELSNTIKQHYGNNFDSYKYLDRFFDLRISLPPANIEHYMRYLQFASDRNRYDYICKLVINRYKLEMREIVKYLRLAKIAAAKPTRDNSVHFGFSDGKAKMFCLWYVIPIMIGLQLKDYDTFIKFKSGDNSLPLIEFFQDEDFASQCLSELLAENECFGNNKAKESNICVKISDKLNLVYNALFKRSYDSINGRRLGKLTFNDDTRDLVLKVCSLLSEHAEYT